MKILIIGGAGYIGSVAVRLFLSHGNNVIVLDSLLFGGESLIDLLENPKFKFINGDIRNEADIKSAINKVDVIINLAAIVGEPLCAKNPELANETNYKAACQVGDIAKKEGVKKYIFVSTCSNYGINTAKEGANEQSEVNPLSLYAETKVNAEKYILGLTSNSFSPTVIRFATVFGLSPRMRFDLLVNEFAKEAFLTGKITVYGSDAFRPLIHVSDAAQALYLIANTKKNIRGEIFNVGYDNYQKKEIVKKIVNKITSAKMKLLDGTGDKRDYRVSFQKIKKILGYKAKYSLEKGIEEIVLALKWRIFVNPSDSRYTNTQKS